MDQSANTVAADSGRNDIPHLRNAVFFEESERGHRLSRFWILLTLAAVIAAAGVVADSTATVIGAMIVAPMMLPIQGTMLATVLGDRLNLVRSILLVVTGAAAAVTIGFVVGLFESREIVAATNAQVAGRIDPGLIDLLAALATGVVGSIALIRRDISDTIPGVAIAISLVPPLVVAGLTLESGAYVQTAGALLLFATNVAAIIATGIVVMSLYRVHRVTPRTADAKTERVYRRHSIAAIATMLTIVVVPLAISSVSSGIQTQQEDTIRSVTEQWAQKSYWDLLSIATVGGQTTVRVTGGLPAPATDVLAAHIEKHGIEARHVKVELVPSQTILLQSPE